MGTAIFSKLSLKIVRFNADLRHGRGVMRYESAETKTPDEKNTGHVYLLGEKIDKPLVHYYKPLSA